MTPTGHGLISIPSSPATAFSSFPPKPPNSKGSKPKIFPQHQRLRIRSKISRRDLASFSFIALVPSPLSLSAPATAISIGISGPKEWLKEQKKKSSRFLLAPIDASRQSLRTAYLLLTESDSVYTNKDIEDVQSLLRSAARDCVPGDRNPFVSFQSNTGVEVCTFRLIVKNAASLLGDKDPVKLEAEAILEDLIRSFSSLTSLANETNISLPSDRQKVADSLMNTISSLNKFEQGIKDCLEI